MEMSTGLMEISVDARPLPPSLTESTKARLWKSTSAVQRSVEAHGYRGYEPFDGLSSPLKSCTFGNLLAERILQQVVRQSPINIRPLIGIKPLDSTKGREGWLGATCCSIERPTKPSTGRTLSNACNGSIPSISKVRKA